MDKAKLCNDERRDDHDYLHKTALFVSEGAWFANKTTLFVSEEGWFANKTAPIACEGGWFANKTVPIACEYPSLTENYALFALNKVLILHYLKVLKLFLL